MTFQEESVSTTVLGEELAQSLAPADVIQDTTEVTAVKVMLKPDLRAKVVSILGFMHIKSEAVFNVVGGMLL